MPPLPNMLAGNGAVENPFLVYTPEELYLVGLFPCEWDKHFRLMADIDLSGFDGKDGRPRFNVIGSDVMVYVGMDGSSVSVGTPFTGVFDGNGHMISRLAVKTGECAGLFGRLEGEVRNLGVTDVNITGGSSVGGIVGCNRGVVLQCHSAGAVEGAGWYVGGLVGENRGSVTRCYSFAAVSGIGYVGGLVGLNWEEGSVTMSYSAGPLSATGSVGGLVGSNISGSITTSFWDIQTSGQTTSDGGTGRSTPQMQTANTFLVAGWDFVGETANGTEDVWWIDEGKNYPRLWWHFKPRGAFFPQPRDGATDVIPPHRLSWGTGAVATQHDVYFGDSETAVADATTETVSVYRGRQARDMTVYDPGLLELGKTYYWRIDEVNETDPNSPWRGNVWSFTTTDYIVTSVVDDFESYTDDWLAGQAVWKTWLDGVGWLNPEPNYPGNGTGSCVGNWEAPFAEQTIVHGGRQSMPMDYNNVNEPWYSEAERVWETSQDWTIDGADTLTLHFRGELGNSPEPLYVGIEDSAGQIAVVVHPDPNAVLATEWQKWHVALDEVRAAGVNVAAVKKMVIGVGDRKNPQPGGTGRIYIDDIRLTKRMP